MRWLLLALAVAVVPAVFVARELYWEPICGEEVLSERKSPNEVFVFSVHRRNCGATTGYVTGLSIRRANDDSDPSAKDDVLVIDGDVSVTASWIDSNRIEVHVPKGAEIFRNDPKWNDVTISYVTH
jgi:hypothetical protein